VGKTKAAFKLDIGRQGVELAVMDEDSRHLLPQLAAGVDDGAHGVITRPASRTQRAGAEGCVGRVAGLDDHIRDRDAKDLGDDLGESGLMAGALRRIALQNLHASAGVDADRGRAIARLIF
jgi:hypothetical protein